MNLIAPEILAAGEMDAMACRYCARVGVHASGCPREPTPITIAHMSRSELRTAAVPGPGALGPGERSKSRERRGLIFALHSNGVTYREIAALLGISSSRVAQIDQQSMRLIERSQHWLHLPCRIREATIRARRAREELREAEDRRQELVSRHRQVFA